MASDDITARERCRMVWYDRVGGNRMGECHERRIFRCTPSILATLGLVVGLFAALIPTASAAQTPVVPGT